MAGVGWDRMTDADFENIGDPAVQAEILAVGEELRFPPRRNRRRDEGWVRGREGKIAWRRGLSDRAAALADDLPAGPDYADLPDDDDLVGERWWEDRRRAWDYYLIYRDPTPAEYEAALRQGEAISRWVVRILHVSDMVRLL
ncbi:hypothetical protein Pta02_24420 [Planobispora takensis]|uniref:Uncharacterized protein n=2 Tax=Planobispora takensis TaxID=1367882 RepID=A0A8J3STN2_9ACTN|nr:hypothetical protein Pta02_24420 [Planobispora takensis]